MKSPSQVCSMLSIYEVYIHIYMISINWCVASSNFHMWDLQPFVLHCFHYLPSWFFPPTALTHTQTRIYTTLSFFHSLHPTKAKHLLLHVPLALSALSFWPIRRSCYNCNIPFNVFCLYQTPLSKRFYFGTRPLLHVFSTIKPAILVVGCCFSWGLAQLCFMFFLAKHMKCQPGILSSLGLMRKKACRGATTNWRGRDESDDLLNLVMPNMLKFKACKDHSWHNDTDSSKSHCSPHSITAFYFVLLVDVHVAFFFWSGNITLKISSMDLFSRHLA